MVLSVKSCAVDPDNLRTAFEYEKNHNMTTLQPFFESSLPKLRHPEVQRWGQDLTAEREAFHDKKTMQMD